MIEYSKNLQIFSTIAYVLAIVIALIFRYFFKDKDDKKKHIPLFIISGLIIVFEICKQLRNATGFDYRFIFGMFRGKYREFDAYALPFHFCSFFTFWCIFQMIFINNEKLGKFFDNMSFLWATFIVLLIIFYPQMIWGNDIERIYDENEIIHGVYFHWFVLVYWFTDLLLRVYEFDFKKIYQAPLCMLIFGAIAIPAAHIFKKNFCSIYSYEGWEFLKPVFDKGYVAYNGLLIVIGIVLSLVIYLLITAVDKLRKKINNKKLTIVGYCIFVVLMIILFFVSKLTGYTVLQPLYSIWLLVLFLISFIPAVIIKEKDIVKA